MTAHRVVKSRGWLRLLGKVGGEMCARKKATVKREGKYPWRDKTGRI